MISLPGAPARGCADTRSPCPRSRQRLRQPDPEIIDKHSLGLEPGKLPATPAGFSLASIIFLDDSMFRTSAGSGQGLLVTFFFVLCIGSFKRSLRRAEWRRWGANACDYLCPPPSPTESCAGLDSAQSSALTGQPCSSIPLSASPGSGSLNSNLMDPCFFLQVLCSCRLLPGPWHLHGQGRQAVI